MKVKFANAEVEVWKLRKGVVLKSAVGFVHIKEIGDIDNIGGNIVIRLWVENAYRDEDYESQDLTWLEPH